MFTTFLPCDWRQEACIATSFESTGFGVQPTIIWGAPTTCAESTVPSVLLCWIYASLFDWKRSVLLNYQDSAEYSMNKTLLFLLQMCALEKAGIPIPLLKHAIDYCLSDIRRTIMLLQFWCQGRKNYIGKQNRCFTRYFLSVCVYRLQLILFTLLVEISDISWISLNSGSINKQQVF